MMDRISINHTLKYVRVWEGGRGAKQTYFTENEYGSMEAAYIAAVQYEASLSADQRIGRIKPHNHPYKTSASGIVGVCPKYNHNGDEQKAWRAHWTEKDKDGQRRPRTKDFYISVHGHQALLMATAHRDKMVKKHMSHNADE